MFTILNKLNLDEAILIDTTMYKLIEKEEDYHTFLFNFI